MSFASLAVGRSTLVSWSNVRRLATALLVLFAMIAVVRRSAGAFVVPLSAAAATDFSLLLAWLVVLAEWRAPPRGNLYPRIAAIVATLSMPTASTAALWCKFGWAPIVALTSFLRRPTVAPPPKFAARIHQQLTRSTDADGRDLCRGTVVAEFVPGQRYSSIHLVFCPPFATTPQLEAAATAAGGAVVKVAQVLPYAARLDVKLGLAAETRAEIEVAYTAAARS